VKPISPENSDVETLIRDYREAAAAQWASIFAGKAKAAQKHSERVVRIYSELRRRGDDARRGLLPLLDDDDPGVRVWAAAHALEFDPNKAEPVLTDLSEQRRGPTATIASYTLQQWRDGTLVFP
jgi:hypothetical protein